MSVSVIVYSLFQQPLLLAVGWVVIVIGTPSETGMTEVKEDRFVCLACQAQHFQAITVPGAPCASIYQEQEFQVCAGVEQTKSYYQSR